MLLMVAVGLIRCQGTSWSSWAVCSTDTTCLALSCLYACAGRRRWVVFADKFDYNPTSVPPEWHGWVNYVNDYEPTHHDFKQPIYHVKATATKTATPEAYNPKGSWFNEQKRNWRKYEAWQPPQA